MGFETEKKKVLRDVRRQLGKFFRSVDARERHPSQWKVPIGGGYFDEKEIENVLDCYLSGTLSTQKHVGQFEKKWAQYVGQKHAIAVNSGSSANLIALNVLLDTGELKPGDEVIVPATTFITVATPVIQLGLVPVYVDIESCTMNMDAQAFARAITSKTKAVMIVHTLGAPADMSTLIPIARKHKLKVIEDCCEAHGAIWKNRRVGSFGDFSTFSFYVAHHITTGEGGMILTNSNKYAEIAREIKEFGRKKYSIGRYGYSDKNLTNFDERYVFNRLGYNMRMSDIQASFGLVQIQRIETLNARRVKIAQYLTKHISDAAKEHLDLPRLPTREFGHTYYTFPLIIKTTSNIDRKKITLYLERNGVETRAIMCGSLPDQPALVNAPGRCAGKLPVARYIRDKAFFIGSHPGLRKQELEHVVKVINAYFE